ncbi:hypothetical protein RF11_08196 [Thelohanellus kitauei]|uniref:Uncharacterized protein n=1 Tax=Thelohanellus kitauei TaxID=669202 RepID=A0A0C2NBU1_THEKT|nr:hypothetical protein RF11_08196 [Thelohanellus kitauei]
MFMSSDKTDIDSLLNVDHRENQRAIHSYIKNAKSVDMSVLMESVQGFIHHFSPQHYPPADYIFIKHFPNKLFEEFHLKCEDRINVNRFVNKLIVHIFTFIFRSTRLLKTSKSRSFIMLFLKTIKTCSSYHEIPIEQILQSIDVCILYEPNKLMFIDENAMCYIYNFLQNSSAHKQKLFWKTCQNVYNWHLKTSSLSPNKLTLCIDRIMTPCTYGCDEERPRIMFILLKILHRLGFLYDVEFNINQLFIITKNILQILDSYNDYEFLGLSIIWCGILNEPRNSFQIDTVDKLKCLSVLFAIDLAWKLKKVLDSSSHFQITKNTKLKLYIINLASICINKFDDLFIESFRPVVKQVNRLLQEYIKICSFEDDTIENQVILLQYCIKGHLSLKTNISSKEEQVYYSNLKRFEKYPSLIVSSTKSKVSSNLHKIKRFIHGLLDALSDETYINKLQTEQSLYLYEGLKSGYLSKINDKCIKEIFSKNASCISDFFYGRTPKLYRNTEYKTYKTVLAMIIISFYESNYMDKRSADYCLKLIEGNSETPSEIQVYSDYVENSFDNIVDTDTKISNKLSIPALLRLFILMFEMKFIFDDLDSKFDGLNFV